MKHHPNCVIRIYIERGFKHHVVTIGMYPVDAYNHYYSLIGPAEGEGNTRDEAMQNALEQWRDIREERRMGLQ